MKNIGDKAKKGIAWITLGRGTVVVVQFGGSVVLARILMPTDFGVNGIAAIFSGLAMRVGNFGFNWALVQKKEITQDHISSVLVVNIVISAILCAVLVSFSPFIGRFFDNPLVGAVTAVISISFIIHAFSGVPQAILQRDMEFKKKAVVLFVSGIVEILVAVVLAVLHYGVWSLVFGKLSGDAVRSIMAILMSGYFPRFKYNHKALKELFSFGIWVFWGNQLRYLTNKVDFFIVGRFLGPASLGFYERAFNITAMPQSSILSGIDGVLFSAFSRIQEEKKRIKSAYKKAVLSVSLFGYPIFTGLFMTAPSLVPVIYGEKWTSTIIPLQILCVIGLIRSIDLLGASVIAASGHLKPQVLRQVIFFIVLTIGCILGSRWGIIGVAIMVVFANILLVLMNIGLLNTVNEITLKDFLIPQAPALTYSLIMAAGIKIFQHYSPEIMFLTSLLELVLTVILGAVIYLTCVFMFKTKLTRPLIIELREDINGFFAKITTKIRSFGSA